MNPDLAARGILALDYFDEPAETEDEIRCYRLTKRPDGLAGDARRLGAGFWRIYASLPVIGDDGKPATIPHTFNVGDEIDALQALEWVAAWVAVPKDEAFAALYDV